LLTFCASASLAAALAFAAVFTGASAVLAVAAPETAAAAEEPNTAAPPPAFSGLITDNQCGARHDKESEKSPSECTLACIRNGASYSLIDGDKKYALDGNADELGRWAGQRVTVAGTRSGDIIKVTSVSSPH
jgi:hypothetical protein